jgi:hypothetical protein
LLRIFWRFVFAALLGGHVNRMVRSRIGVPPTNNFL